MQEIDEELKGLEMWNPETIDFYRVLGSKDRLLIHPLSSYFRDTQSYTSFIRLRRDHLTKLGAENSIEIGETDYLQWQKSHKPQKGAEDVLF